MKADRVQRRVASAVLALYLVALLLIAFWPSPVDRGLSGPTGPIDRFVAWCGRHGLPWMSYGIIEWSANVIYFVPFGVLACVLVGLRRWWLAVLIAAGASVVIELGQAAFLAERTASGLDVLANSLGALCGALIAVWAGRAPVRMPKAERAAEAA